MKLPFLAKKRIYADWAATTPPHPRVAKAMDRARRAWANPSAIHKEGVEAKKALESRRSDVARLVGVKPEEVYFTSGGTEANGTIIQGVLRMRMEGADGAPASRPQDVHVVSSSIEHSSVLETLKLFQAHGVRVTYVAPGTDGIVRADDILAAVTPQTVLVTCMYANNEIGTVQQVSRIGAGVRKIRAGKVGEPLGAYPVFHVDAAQAPLWLSCEMEGLRADAATFDGHKMQGPKGVGALIVRRHAKFQPLMVGGGQERGSRPTTESLELVMGFAEALAIACEGRVGRAKAAAATQDYFMKRVAAELPAAVINGSTDKRLPNNINLSLPTLSDPEFAVLQLDKAGIACSTKSSCLKGEENSYVVAALGGDAWRAKNTLRFTLAPDATKGEVNYIIGTLRKIIA